MAHTPYGYNIIDGKAVIDNTQADQVRALFEADISGMGLMAAAKKAGLNIYHGSAGRMLRNTHYLGDEYYPEIIDKATFDKAEEVRMAKANYLKKYDKELKVKESPEIPSQFKMARPRKKYSNPYEQAEYLYGLIESEG